MAGRDDAPPPPPPPPGDRIELRIRDGIFDPYHSRVSRFISAQFGVQTCAPGWSWRYVTPEQRQWYWERFCLRYTWAPEIDAQIRDLWFRNTATLYRRTIHSWRTSGRHPQSVTPERWAEWMAAWQRQDWVDRAQKNKANRHSEPAGVGTGTIKHIAGAKTYSAHGHDLRAVHGRDPTSWEIYVRTHRHDDGSFVDSRSQRIHDEMSRWMDQSMTPAEGTSEPTVPSPQSVNSMFKTVVGGKKKGRMYGCGSMATTLYPDEMAPGRRGGPPSSSRSSDARFEELQQQRDADRQENDVLRDRVASLEEQVRLLVARLPPPPPPQGSRRALHGAGKTLRGRSSGAVGASSSRRHLYSDTHVSPTQGFGDDDDEEDDDADDYDDDSTQSP